MMPGLVAGGAMLPPEETFETGAGAEGVRSTPDSDGRADHYLSPIVAEIALENLTLENLENQLHERGGYHVDAAVGEGSSRQSHLISGLVAGPEVLVARPGGPVIPKKARSIRHKSM